MAKVTNKNRLEIWEKWKGGKGSAALSREYGINESIVEYLVRLLNKHGPEILRNGKNMYTAKN